MSQSSQASSTSHALQGGAGYNQLFPATASTSSQSTSVGSRHSQLPTQDEEQLNAEELYGSLQLDDNDWEFDEEATLQTKRFVSQFVRTDPNGFQTNPHTNLASEPTFV